MTKSMMTKDHLPTRTRRVMNITIQNQMSKLLRNSQWNIRLKPLLQQPRRTQNKSSLNNSKRSKAKHPSYLSRENKQLQKPSFWNRLSKKAALAQSLTGHRLSQTQLPMLVAKWLLPTRWSTSYSPRKRLLLPMAWVTGKSSTREKPKSSRKKALTATWPVLFHLTQTEKRKFWTEYGILKCDPWNL